MLVRCTQSPYQWSCFLRRYASITNANNCLAIVLYCFPSDFYLLQYSIRIVLDFLHRLACSSLASYSTYRSQGLRPFSRPRAPSKCCSDDVLLPYSSYGLLLYVELCILFKVGFFHRN